MSSSKSDKTEQVTVKATSDRPQSRRSVRQRFARAASDAPEACRILRVTSPARYAQRAWSSSQSALDGKTHGRVVYSDESTELELDLRLFRREAVAQSTK